MVDEGSRVGINGSMRDQGSEEWRSNEGIKRVEEEAVEEGLRER